MRSVIAAIGLAFCFAVAPASADTSKSYTEGAVTELSYIKVKPGKFDDYLKYLDTTYKTVMEANKKAGLITAYAVYSAQARSPQEPDLILSVVYANMAALDRIEEGEAVAAKVMGTPEAQSKAAIDRESLREVLGTELVSELVLK